MGKKLLSIPFIGLLFFLISWSGFGQACPSGVSISSDPGTTICEGTSITFKVTPTGGTQLKYQWKVGTTNVGTSTTEYIHNNPIQGQQISVVITSDDDTSCSITRTFNSLTVNPLRTPTVSISTNKTSICSGENITFNASNTNGGSGAKYDWYINGSTTIAKTGSSVTFPSSDFNAGTNNVRVVLTSSLDCVTSETAEAVSGNIELKPDATISDPSNKNQDLCINTALGSVSFAIGGGGTGATVSGLPPGVTGSYSAGTYTLSGNPTASGEFNYTITTTGTCAQTTATGTIKVNPNATISLNSGNNNQTVCAAGGVADANIEAITYSIGETGTGAKVTGLPSGITGSFNNGIFTIEGSSSITGTHNYTVTAEGTCGDSSSVSGSITITENLAPSVSIISSEDEICAGSSVTFTATPLNGGSSPDYQWQVNGNNVGSNSNTFISSSLTDGQTVTVIMTSNETCRTENTATSNGISITVNENLTPSVTIDPSDTEFCSGDEITYTAVPVNGGTSPSYQWRVGSTVVGSGATFTSSTLTNGQSITVIITSNETCVSSATAVSEPVVTSVNENLFPSITIDSNDENNIICSGSSITFTANHTNGGSNPQYQWQINGNNSGGITTSHTFNPESLNNGDIVSAVLISSEECLAENNVESNEVPVQVDISISGITPEWDNTNTSHNPTAICPVVSDLVYKIHPIAGATSYNWTFPNNGWSIVSGAGENEITVRAGSNASGGNISVQGLTECDSSNPISIPVTTGTVVLVDAGPDQTVCPGTVEINLNGEIGGVITQKKDWNWSDNGAGGSFKNNQGSDIKGIYTIPTSLRNGGTITITITSIDPPGVCGPKSDSMTLKIESAASITDAANKNQTVCLNSEIDDISFSVGGAGNGATATGLPIGITGSFEDGIFTLSGTPTVAGTFNYTVTTTGNCTNATRNGTITVNDRPIFTQPTDIFACAGESIPTISFEGSSVTGTTHTWTNDNPAIGLPATGSGNVNTFEATNTTNAPITANIIVTPAANSCEGTPQEFQITVYPTATFNKPVDIEICNSETVSDIVFSGNSVEGTTYQWSNDNPSIGLLTSGTGNINSFTAENNTNEIITANITVTPLANGCEGTAETFSITVNPSTSFTQPEDIVVCNNKSTSEINFVGGSVVGTTFSWTNDNTAIGLAASGSGNLPVFSATNSGTQPIFANITVTPEANECEGTPRTFQVIVNPTPIVTVPSTIVLCNGEEFTGANFSGNVDGISYTWSNTQISIGLGQSGEDYLPAFTAINTTDLPVTAVISVIPTANECEGIPVDFEIVINPSATVEAGPDITICSNGNATMAAVIGGGATSGSWTTSGSGSFSDNSLTSVYTPSAIDVVNGSVTLTYTTNDPDGPCGPVSDSLELTLNEEVVITTHPENIGVCSTEPSALSVIASGANLNYEWKRVDNAAIINATGINSPTLTFNNTTSTNEGKYYVVVTGEDTCEEAISDTVSINVDENIIIEEPQFPVPECGDGFSEVTMKFIAHANGSPLTFTWYKGNTIVDDSDPNITIITGEADAAGRYEGTLEIINLTTTYNGDYYVEVQGPEEFTCSTAITNPFLLRLNEMPALPEVEEIVYCQGDEAEPLTVISGSNLTWYATATGDDAFNGTPTPGTSNFGETSYWVTQTPDVCESERVEVIVSVKEKPGIPVVENIEFCLGAASQELTATGAANATLNWYNSAGEALTGAPTPATETAGDFIYYVSQTPNDGFGCESDRAEITVTVYPLPVVTASVEEEIICLGSPAELTATGGVSYIWYDGEEVIGNDASISHPITVAGDYIFTVVVTDANGCENTALVNVQVDDNTVAGIISGQESVCITSPSGSFNLEGNTGEIQRWESSTDNGTSWTEIANNSATFDFADLTTTTSFRAVVKNGVCEELPSNEIQVTIDPLPVGGELAFAGNGRVFTICENPVGNYAVDLNLTDIVGEVLRWGYRNWDATTYTDLRIDGELFTGNTLTAAQIQALGFNETTVFQVEVTSGVCEAPALSKTAILSVIPSDITPTPVTVDPGVVCFGEEVTLSSETGYGTGDTFLDRGAFDNASITQHGWRIRRGNSTTDLGFDTDANNVVPDRWKRATPRAFSTASTTSPYSTSGVVFDTGIEDGNKGFAIVSGNNTSTMETPIFTIGSMDQAILTFDQAYVLTPGASLKVEISTDGGNTYTTLYLREVPAVETQGIASGNTTSFGIGTIDSHPENKILIDLGNYIGRPNLRIRFNYTGVRPGDIWAIDNIEIPQGPNGITMEWRDYTDPAFPEGILIGTNNSENYTPLEIGLNTFEVKTKLVYNSSGDACEVAENAQRIDVFVFDKYTTNVTANFGSCGNFSAQLNAIVTNGSNDTIQSYPTPDGYIGRWEIIGGGTLVDSDPNDEIEAINDPNAILSTEVSGAYTASWILEPTEVDENGNLYVNPEACPPVVNPLEVVIEGCTALDFDGFNDYIDLGTNYTGSNYSIEAWIRPFNRDLEAGGQTDASNGTIISGAGFEIKMQDLPTSISPNGRWYHIAYTSDGNLYIDGIQQNSNSITGVGGSQTLIGARWNSSEKTAENHFSGWIEEVRIWNGTITEKNIQFTMNQRLKGTGNIGEEVDMAHPDAPLFTNLAGYYRLISALPDPINLVNHAAELLPINGTTIDLATNSVPGVLKNMTTNQENTAPLPYITGLDGDWDTGNTWARPAVWQIPNTGGLNWNIVQTWHNVSANREIKVLGLLSEENTLDIVGTNPGGWVGGGTGNALYITHYLLLNGVIDLNGESQVLQPELSIVDGSSSGVLHRDQQGTANSYNYNYWSSPVSESGSNAAYTVAGVLRDGTNPAAPLGIDFGNPYAHADAGKTNPIKISNYWISTYNNQADIYDYWNFQYGSEAPINAGEGYTMKGTSGAVNLDVAQNYTFIGLPHNGLIELNSTEGKNYLLGNPYPSAIDAEEFIRDNLSGRRSGNNFFDGTLYFWDHFGKEDSHILLEYIGGYAAMNFTGAVPAISNDERINATLDENNKYPGPYIPVGQGFFINTSEGDGYTVSTGKIQFKNSQRYFVTENSLLDSQFLRPEVQTKKSKKKEFEKIRLSYKSPIGYYRQILVGAHPEATDGFDLGYDARLFDYNEEDMYWIQGHNLLVIQGVPDFGKERVLPLGVVLKEEGEFTIQIDSLENFADLPNVYINDKHNDSVHNLTKRPFTANSKAGYIHDRFEIIFYYEEELPVDPGGEVVDAIELNVRHGHNVREIQILNPDQIPLNDLHLFDVNGNLITTYRNLSHEKEVRLPVRSYSSGVYIIKLYGENIVISKKIIINN